MTANEFFWYVFPWLVSAGGLCWLAYDRYRHPER